MRASIFLLFATGLIGCKTTDTLPTDFETAPLLGMVYSTDNRPVNGMRISLDETNIAESDIEGRFIFPEVARGEHVLVAKKPGFESISFEFEFTDRTQVLHLQTTSSEGLIRKLEQSIERRDWESTDEIIERTRVVGERTAEVFYLAAVSYFLRSDGEQVRKYVSLLAESGVNSEFVQKLREMSSDDATFNSYLELVNTPQSAGPQPAEEMVPIAAETEVIVEPDSSSAVTDDVADRDSGTRAPARSAPIDDASTPQPRFLPLEEPENEDPPSLPKRGESEDTGESNAGESNATEAGADTTATKDSGGDGTGTEDDSRASEAGESGGDAESEAGQETDR